MAWNVTTTTATVVTDHRRVAGSTGSATDRFNRPYMSHQQRALPSGDDAKEGDTNSNTTTGGSGEGRSTDQTGGSGRRAGFRTGDTSTNGGRADGAASGSGDQQEAIQEGITRLESGGAVIAVEVEGEGDAALARRFLCGISPRAMAVAAPLIEQDTTPRVCAKCGSTKAGIISAGVRKCHQCYFSKDEVKARQEEEEAVEAQQPREHRCELCKTRYGVSLREDDLKWTCSQCWVKAGRPKLCNKSLEKTWNAVKGVPANVDNDPIREARRRDAARGIQVVGSM
jgi:ribosomal protein L37AE/L43A